MKKITKNLTEDDFLGLDIVSVDVYLLEILTDRKVKLSQIYNHYVVEDDISSWTISSPCYDMATSQKIYKYLANQKDLTIRLKINIGGFGTYCILSYYTDDIFPSFYNEVVEVFVSLDMETFNENVESFIRSYALYLLLQEIQYDRG